MFGTGAYLNDFFRTETLIPNGLRLYFSASIKEILPTNSDSRWIFNNWFHDSNHSQTYFQPKPSTSKPQNSPHFHPARGG